MPRHLFKYWPCPNGPQNRPSNNLFNYYKNLPTLLSYDNSNRNLSPSLSQYTFFFFRSLSLRICLAVFLSLGFFFSPFMCEWAGMLQWTTGCHRTTCIFRGLHLNYQTWLQVPVPTKPSYCCDNFPLCLCLVTFISNWLPLHMASGWST